MSITRPRGACATASRLVAVEDSCHKQDRNWQANERTSMRSLPEAFVAGEQRQHIALELGRAETETLATSAEKEWPSSALSELAHPFDQRIVRILPGWQQDVRRQLAPADWNDDYTEMVRAELLRKRAVRREPATNEVATRLDRTFVVNGAAFGAQKMARLARKHFIPPDI